MTLVERLSVERNIHLQVLAMLEGHKSDPDPLHHIPNLDGLISEKHKTIESFDARIRAEEWRSGLDNSGKQQS